MMGYRWRGFEHRELHTMINEGPGAAASDPQTSYWDSLTNELAEVDELLSRQLTDLKATWEGQAADSAQNGLTPLAAWASDAETGSTVMRLSSEYQADYISGARASMPPPVEVTTPAPTGWQIAAAGAAAFLGDAGPALAVAKQASDNEAQEAAKAEAEQIAIETMQTYESSSVSNRETLGTFVAPPDVVVSTPEPKGGTAGHVVGGVLRVNKAGTQSTQTAGFAPTSSGPSTSTPPSASYPPPGSTPPPWQPPVGGTPPGGYPPPGSTPPGGYPPGSTPPGGYPPGSSTPPAGYPSPGSTPPAGYPAPGSTPPAGYPPAGGNPPGGYPPPGGNPPVSPGAGLPNWGNGGNRGNSTGSGSPAGSLEDGVRRGTASVPGVRAGVPGMGLPGGAVEQQLGRGGFTGAGMPGGGGVLRNTPGAASAAGRGGAGVQGPFAPGGRSDREEDEERFAPAFLLENADVFGESDQLVAPSVIGG